MVTILESVEDDSYFFAYLSFTNNKLTNKFTTYLDMVVHMYTKKTLLAELSICYCDQSMDIKESLDNTIANNNNKYYIYI